MNFFEENSIQLIVFCMTLVKEENSKGMMEQKKNKHWLWYNSQSGHFRCNRYKPGSNCIIDNLYDTFIFCSPQGDENKEK